MEQETTPAEELKKTPYDLFKEKLAALDTYIKESKVDYVESEVCLDINDENVDEFTKLLNELCDSAIVNDDYVNEVLEFLNNLQIKTKEVEMIIKLLPMYAAIHCFYVEMQGKKKKKAGELEIGSWVYETNTFTAPLETRFGIVTDIFESPEKNVVVKIKTPMTGEFIDWEDAQFFVIPNMTDMVKNYEKYYSRKF